MSNFEEVMGTRHVFEPITLWNSVLVSCNFSCNEKYIPCQRQQIKNTIFSIMKKEKKKTEKEISTLRIH